MVRKFQRRLPFAPCFSNPENAIHRHCRVFGKSLCFPQTPKKSKRQKKITICETTDSLTLDGDQQHSPNNSTLVYAMYKNHKVVIATTTNLYIFKKNLHELVVNQISYCFPRSGAAAAAKNEKILIDSAGNVFHSVS
jgi:hypothetical protein